MQFRFKTKTLSSIYYQRNYQSHYPPEIVQAFRETVTIIEAATNERDFYQFKSLHYEKLQGKIGSAGEHSMRLNKQYRLIVRIEADDEGKLILVIEINKHYE